MEINSSLECRIQQLLFKPRFLTHLLVASSIFASSNTWADNDFASMTGFPLIPGVTATGLAGPTVMGLFDAMVPLVGWPTSFFYIDPQFSIQNGDNYSGAGGAGYRWLNDQAGILGAYVFTDYLHSPNNNNFWFVSPGIERLGNTIDFSANAYIPVSDQTQSLGLLQGTEIGENQFVSFQGHNQYDALFYANESVGFGADAQIGYRLPIVYNPKVFVGGYYSNPQSDTQDNIWGGTVRVEMPVTQNIRVSLSEAYDNFYHNTFKVGLSVDLVGRHTQKTYRENDLASRMLDPVQRNLILVAGGSVTNQPIIQDAAQFADAALVRSNISFFESAGTDPNSSQEGTFENPYQGLTQGHVDDGNTKGNNTFYFNTGTYIQNSTINFTNDDIYGRQTFNGLAFALPASGNSRPVFNFSGMNTGVDTAFNVLATQDLEIKDIVMIGNDSSTGILITTNNATAIDLKVSDIEINNFGTGISVMNTGQIGTFLLSDNVVTENTGNGFIFTNENAVNNLDIENSQFTNNGDSGITIQNTGTIAALLIDHTTINNNGSAISNGGIFIQNTPGHLNDITLNDTQINQNKGGGVIIDNSTSSNVGDVNITQNTNINNNSGNGLLINNLNSTFGALNITESTIQANDIAGVNMNNTNSTVASILVDNSNLSSNNADGFVLTNQASNFTDDITFRGSIINNNMGNGILITNLVNNVLQNISLTNGSTVNNNGMMGFYIFNPISSIQNVAVNASSLNNNGSNGFSITNFSNAALNNVNVNSSTFNNNAVGGIVIENSDDSIMNDINIISSSANNNALSGVAIQNIINSIMKDINLVGSITINNNTGDGLSVSNEATMGNINFSSSDITELNANTGSGFFLNNLGTIGLINSTFTTFEQNGDYGVLLQNMGVIDGALWQFGDFSINQSAGFALINDGGSFSNDITIHLVNIIQNGSDGIHITNQNGGVLQNINIDTSFGEGILSNANNGVIVNNADVTSTIGNVNFGAGEIIGNLNTNITVENAGTLGVIGFNNTLIGNSGNEAVSIQNFGTMTGVSMNGAFIDNNGESSPSNSLVLVNSGTVTGNVTLNNVTAINGSGNGIYIDNQAGTMGDVSITGGNIATNAGNGLIIFNSGISMNDITLTNASLTQNGQNGFLFSQFSGSTVNSITLDTITAINNVNTNVFINTIGATITDPGGNVVSDPNSNIGSKSCFGCTFNP